MSVTGAETLSDLRASLAEKLQQAEEMHGRNLKGELSPDEVAAMKDLGDEIAEYEAAIKAFPTVENFREKTIDGTKKFLRAKATPAPPSAGQSTRGDGGNTKSFGHGDGGSPMSAHERAGMTLGGLVVEQMKSDMATGRRIWEPGRNGQAWACEFKGMINPIGLGYDNDTMEIEGESIKSTLLSTTSALTRYDRQPGIVDVRQQRLTIADLLAQGTTDGPTIRYVREISFTNAATSVAENAQKPEAAGDLEEVDAQVRKVAVIRKISDEMLADHAQLQSYIDGRLRFMVLQREEALLLSGNGTPPNIQGILATSGIQTQAQDTGLTAMDAIHMAITKIRAVGFDEPDGIVIHPTDWQTLKLHTDANDQYYGGGPFYTPYAGSGQFQGVQTIWGLPAVVTTAITQGTALVGAFGTAAQMFRRSGVTVQMTNSNEDDFEFNRVTIRAESRLALAVYRPLSFATVTSITAGTAA